MHFKRPPWAGSAVTRAAAIALSMLCLLGAASREAAAQYSQQGSKLVASDAVGSAQQGYSVGATTAWEGDALWKNDPVMLPFRAAARAGRFPGYAGPADRKAAEVLSKYIITDMYAKAVQGMPAEEAVKWAAALLVNGPTALAASKEIVWHSVDWTDEEAWREQMKYARRALESEDRKEGLAAFAEKRRPVWSGR